MLVVGDLMLDRYVTGTVERVSPEAPIPVMRVDDEDEMLGGAGNVARNIASLGGQVILVGLIGDDLAGASSLDVPGLGDSDLAEQSFGQELASRLGHRTRSHLGTVLHDALVFLGRRDDRRPLVEDVGHRLLDVDVLAGGQGQQGDPSVPVVGCSDDDDVDVVVFNDIFDDINGRDTMFFNILPLKYQWAYELYKEMKNNHWEPEDIALRGDAAQWASISVDQQQAVQMLLGYQATSGEITGAEEIYAIRDIVTAPELKLVFGRYVLNDTPTWIEQSSLLIVVYITCLGAGAGVRFNSHLSIDFLREGAPRIPRVIMHAISDGFVLLFGGFMAWQGWLMMMNNAGRPIPMIGLSESWRAAPLVACGVLLVIFTCANLIQRITRTGRAGS